MAQQSEIVPLDIFCYYGVQRFTQMGALDAANWYRVAVPDTKTGMALYPAMGRRHVEVNGNPKLIFSTTPRAIFKSINFMYVVVGPTLYLVDAGFNATAFSISMNENDDVWFAYLPVGTTTYCMLTDGLKSFLVTEDGIASVTAKEVTDLNKPVNPQYVATFGNRFVVSTKDTPNFQLGKIGIIDETDCWTVSNALGGKQTARATGKIRQFGVLHNQLYIMCDFSTDVWANIPTTIVVDAVSRTFPWKLNSSYDFDYGISDPHSLSIDFGRMVWLAKNDDGLVSFVVCTGQAPQDISSQAINVLIENSRSSHGESAYITSQVNGFLYQYENTIFYRVSAGLYNDSEQLDYNQNASSLEFNFETGTWARCIELNGERNRILKHVYYNDTHLVTVQDDIALYEMAGNIYHNELYQAPTETEVGAFIRYPMRYELVTKQIFLPDYSQFMEKWIEIDFVFGDKTFYKQDNVSSSAMFYITEDSAIDNPTYIVSENDEFIVQDSGSTVDSIFDENYYYQLLKPYIELYYSDDGGVTFNQAYNKEFSQLGEYRFRMRWYELAISRNRCYRLVCVSSAPIVILGAIRNTQAVSGGAK